MRPSSALSKKLNSKSTNSILPPVASDATLSQMNCFDESYDYKKAHETRSMGNVFAKDRKSTSSNPESINASFTKMNGKKRVNLKDNDDFKNSLSQRSSKQNASTSKMKEYEEGECDSSSDDDIIVIDENGDKLQDRQSMTTLRSRNNHEPRGNQEVLCEFNKIAITVHDYKTLKEGEYLNDTIIDFYLTFLFETKLSKELKEDVHIYSSHFYSRLKGNSNNRKLSGRGTFKGKTETAYERVKSWTRKMNLFSKRMLIFPICEEDHWYLIIVCNPGLIESSGRLTLRSNTVENNSMAVAPSILLLDSLGLSQYKSVGKIRSYLHEEYFERKKESVSFGRNEMKLSNLIVPLQPNECDCGLYLLHYVELIFHDPCVFLQSQLPDLSNWFSSEDIENKRKDISFVIQRLANTSAVDQLGEKIKDSSRVRHKKSSSDKLNLKEAAKMQSSFKEKDEPCMLFRSPPREEESVETEPRNSYFTQSSNLTKADMIQEKIDCDKTNSYDISDNLHYFGNKSKPLGIISRIAKAFNEHSPDSLSKKDQRSSSDTVAHKNDKKRKGEAFSSPEIKFSNQSKRLRYSDSRYRQIDKRFEKANPNERVVILHQEKPRNLVIF